MALAGASVGDAGLGAGTDTETAAGAGPPTVEDTPAVNDPSPGTAAMGPASGR